MYFSETFGITRTQSDDWFDPILSVDTKLFIDPFLIFKDPNAGWTDAHHDLIEHFNVCFRLIAEGNRNPATVPYKKAIALLRFPEPREFCLGYTERGTQGAGGGLGFARMIARAMSDAIERGLQDLKHFEELGVLNEGIGPDRISDLTCNVLRRYFITYTEQVAARHGLPTVVFRVGGAAYDATRQAWRSEDRSLPRNPFIEKPVLLAPQRFLRDLPTLNPDDWWENYEAEQLRNDLNYEVLGKVNKGAIVAAARRNPENVRKWSRTKEDTDPAPYDFDHDRLGVWRWLQAAQEFVASQPLTLAPPSDDGSFVATIDLVIEKYRHFVEQQGGWRLLWNDGNADEKPEEAAQLLFKGIAQSYCQANNIVIDREVNLGRGPVDFKFSNGYQQRALLEVKKVHNGKFWNGLTEQLPSYLESDECKLGWFMAVRYRATGSTVEWLTKAPAIVRRLAEERSLTLRTVSIDARPKPSASRLGDTGGGLSEPEREGPIDPKTV